MEVVKEGYLLLHEQGSFFWTTLSQNADSLVFYSNNPAFGCLKAYRVGSIELENVHFSFFFFHLFLDHL